MSKKTYYATDRMPRLWRGVRRPATGDPIELSPEDAEYELMIGTITADAPAKDPPKPKVK